MKISKELVLKIIKYLKNNEEFYFPFKIICNDVEIDSDYYDIDCIELEYDLIKNNSLLINFTLEENIQNLYKDTTGLLAKGFIDKIIGITEIEKISSLANKYRSNWKEELWESEDSEEFGLNEFIGGKAEAFEECLEILNRYRNS